MTRNTTPLVRPIVVKSLIHGSKYRQNHPSLGHIEQIDCISGVIAQKILRMCNWIFECDTSPARDASVPMTGLTNNMTDDEYLLLAKCNFIACFRHAFRQWWFISKISMNVGSPKILDLSFIQYLLSRGNEMEFLYIKYSVFSFQPLFCFFQNTKKLIFYFKSITTSKVNSAQTVQYLQRNKVSKIYTFVFIT